jgi:hypothetical protein
VEEVRRLAARSALSALFFYFVTSIAEANVCVSPKIRSSEACGIVLDPFGEVIPHVTITLKDESHEASTTSDENGRFQLTRFSGSKVAVKATANGFMAAYSSIEQVKVPTAACKRPIYIMLQVGGDGCTMISLKKSDLPIAKRD